MPQFPLHRLGVCSWSLRADSPAQCVERVLACGVRRVQLHLDPLRTLDWRADEVAGLFRAARIAIVSGMMTTKGEDYSSLESIKRTGGIRPDETWDENLRAAEGNAVFAARLGIGLVTLHAGFLPHAPSETPAVTGSTERDSLIARLVRLAEVFANRRIRLGLETGQESASTLLEVLAEVNRELPSYAAVGVNFDPANMILYGMGDPVEALSLLAPHILQVHIKDALPSDSLGEWGAEVPFRRGSVRWDAFFEVLAKLPVTVPLMIEREAGDQRVEDIASAVTAIRAM